MRKRERTIVLLHGFTGSRESWASLLPFYEKRAARVFAVDLPGHGTNASEDCSLDAMSKQVAGLLDEGGVGHRILVGYSLGARVALFAALAAQVPVDGLVLESVNPGLEVLAEREARKATDDALAEFIEANSIEAFVDRWEQTPVLRTLLDLPLEERQSLRRIRTRQVPAGLARSLRGAGLGNQPYLAERAGSFDQPVLLLAGRKDPKFSAIAKDLTPRFPNGTLKIIEDAGHTVHLENRSRYENVVAQWLERNV